MYQPKGLAEIIFRDRYASHKEETWEEACDRVASSVAHGEENGKYVVWKERFKNLLVEGKFCPGGRIWYGAGRPKQQLMNCYVLPAEDSREGWGKATSDMIVVSGTGGGVGINGSQIRPRGTKIRGTGGTSTGAVSFFDILNAAGEVIKGGGGRRTALMLCLDLAHPDVVEFIDKKFTKTKRDTLDPEQVAEFIRNEFGLYSLPKELRESLDSLCGQGAEWDVFIQGLSDLFLQKNLKNANVSIVFSTDPEEFFEKVRNNEQWELKWQEEVVSTVSARELWNKIITNFIDGGEPGILNAHLANKMNNIYYCHELISTNPCSVYDTMVYVADGRGNVKIGDLAKEGKDVPVFCLNDKQQVVVRWMRNPRKTGNKAPIYKTTLDDGSVLRTTDNHKFKLRTGEHKEVKDLKEGDSLYLLTRYEASIKDIFPKANSRSQNYFWISRPTFGSTTAEHKIISEFFLNEKIETGKVVHHKDFNAQNNSWDNLEVMTKSAHDKLHSKNMIGDKNPMRRAKYEWSKEKWADYKEKQSKAQSGQNNGRYSGLTNDKLKEHSLELTEKLNRRFSTNDWIDFAKERGLPQQFSKWRKSHLGGVVGLAKWAAFKLGFDNIDCDPRTIKSYQEYSALGYDCDIVGGHILLNKSCEVCDKVFQISYSSREQGVCSHSCRSIQQWKNDRECLLERIEKYHNKKRIKLREKQLIIYKDLKFKLKRDSRKEEWKQVCKDGHVSNEISRKSSPFVSWKALKEASTDFNHKVVSIEIDGHEDVYNGTVDEYHNFFVGAFEDKTKNGKKKWNYVNNPQCGEIWLEEYGACDLGALVLHRFLNETQADFDWDSLADAITAGVRFLDNVLSVNNYPLPEIAQNCQEVRRIGLGVMALHDALLMMGIKYSSDEGLKKIDELFSFIKNKSYEASTYLAVEKGVFPKFDKVQFLKSGFVKGLKKSVRAKIKEHGMRNCCLLTIAPTGTTSILMGCPSSGIEPIFAPAWWRIFYSPDGEKRRELVFHPLFKQMYQEGKSLEHFESAYFIRPERHMAVQAVCQKHIDNAVSKTVNIPAERYSLEEFSEILMEYIPKLKGCTVYKAGSRGDEPLQALPLEEAISLLNDDVKAEVDQVQLLKQDCPDGLCTI